MERISTGSSVFYRYLFFLRLIYLRPKWKLLFLVQNVVKKRVSFVISLIFIGIGIGIIIGIGIGTVSAVECSVSLQDDCTVSANTVLSSGASINDSNKNGVIIINSSNIILDCNNYAIKWTPIIPGTIGILNPGFSNVTIKNCTIYGYETGIKLQSSNNNKIINNSVDSNRNGILLKTSHNCVISNNTARFNTWDGIGLDDSHGNTITNNNLTFVGIKGIHLMPDRTNMSVTCNNSIDATNLVGKKNKPILYYNDTSGLTIRDKNDIYGRIMLCNVTNSLIDNVSVIDGDGITLYHTDNITVTNSKLNLSTGVGCIIWYSSNITIKDNQFFNSNDDNINLCGAKHNLIENNTLSSPVKGSHEGIHMYERTCDTVIRNNIIHNHAISGIANTAPIGSVALCSLGGPNLNTTIENNKIYDNGKNISVGWDGSGVLLVGQVDNTSIKNNMIFNNQHSGVHLTYFSGLYLREPRSNKIFDNNITNNKLDGVTILNGQYNIIHSNIITSNARDGVYVSFSNNVVSNNTLINNSYGMRAIMSANITILNNTIKNNQIDGVAFATSTSSKITGNIINSNLAHGIYFTDNLSTGNVVNSNQICYSSLMDINDVDSNTGANNTCNKTSPNWADSGVVMGCTNVCPSPSVPACITPTDDLIVNSNTVLCSGTYNIPDAGSNGVIIINASNVVLDCNGANLQGSGTYGIYVFNKNNVTIKNCIMKGYFYGIYAYTFLSTIKNNTLDSNNYGLYLSGSNRNIVTNNTIKDSYFYDLLVFATSDNDCNNTISNNIGAGNRLIKFYNSSVNLQNQVLSELVLCNADNSVIKNVSIIGSSTRSNNAVYVSRTNDSILNNISSSNNRNGIILFSSFNNTISNSFLNMNGEAGIQLSQSGNNTILNNTVNLNNYGIWLFNSKNNHILNNTGDNNGNYGLFINTAQSTGNSVIGNRFCDQNPPFWAVISYKDIYDADSNTGNQNTCGKVYNWNDTGTTGCTYPCSANVNTATGTGTAYFSGSSGAIINLSSVNESSLPMAGKPNVTFPHGLFSFNITGLSSGQSVTVTITYPSNIPVGTKYWKYGPTQSNNTSHWYNLSIGDDDGDNIITVVLTVTTNCHIFRI